MITVTHVEGEGYYVSEITVDRRILGFPVQMVSERLDVTARPELAGFGFYPIRFEFKTGCFLYARGRFACLVLRAYHRLAGFFWRRVMKPLYWVGVIDLAPEREFRWTDFWRIKLH